MAGWTVLATVGGPPEVMVGRTVDETVGGTAAFSMAFGVATVVVASKKLVFSATGVPGTLGASRYLSSS